MRLNVDDEAAVATAASAEAANICGVAKHIDKIKADIRQSVDVREAMLSP